ncbi:MAG: DUF2157 domain-containing protein [Polyangiales bacterium]|jgi:uncharacterized membrane protein
MKLTDIDRAFEVWRQQGLLDQRQVDELRRSLDESQSSLRSGRAVALFSTLGAVLLGLGVILFVASHWDTMGPLARSSVLIAAYATTCAGAYVTHRNALPLVSEALWFLATLVLGADIFLIGQIFNFTLTFWQGPFLWFVGALAMGSARHKDSYGWLATPLGVLALGWVGGGSGSFFDDQFEFLSSDGGLLPLLPVIGVALICIAGLVRDSERLGFVRRACAFWGLGLISIPLIAGTGDDSAVKEIFRTAFTSKQVVILAASGLTVALFAFRGRVSTLAASAVGLLLLSSVGLLIPSGSESAIGSAIADHGAAFAAYIVLVFALAMGTIWLGLAERSAGLINVGLLSAAMIIFIQYFSWSFELLDRSVAFIIGGLVLLGVGYGVERTRRHLLARMEAA